MENVFVWPYLRSVKLLFIMLTFGCVIYMVCFAFTMVRGPVSTNSARLPEKDTAPDEPALEVDLKPYESLASMIQTRDIFSSGTINAPGALEQTPMGQLPAHLKVVGIVIAHPSQVLGSHPHPYLFLLNHIFLLFRSTIL